MAPPIVVQQPGVIYGTPPVLPVYSMQAVENNILADDLQDYDRYVPMWDDPFERALANQGGLLGVTEYPGPNTPRFYMSGVAARPMLNVELPTLRGRGMAGLGATPAEGEALYWAVDKQVQPTKNAIASAESRLSSNNQLIGVRASQIGNMKCAVARVETNQTAWFNKHKWDDGDGVAQGLNDLQTLKGLAATAGLILKSTSGQAGLGWLGATAPASQDAVKVTMPQPIKTSTIYAVVGVSAVAIIGSVALWAYFRSKGK